MSLSSSPDFAGIRERALAELQSAADANAKQAWRNRYLGRQGETQKLLDGLKSLPTAERPAAGKAANDLRKVLEEAWAEKGEAKPERLPLLPVSLIPRCRVGRIPLVRSMC